MYHNQSVPATTGPAGTTKVNLDGVSIYYNPHIDPNRVKIGYNGMLDHDSTQNVYLHTGMSEEQQNWSNVYDYPMERTCNGWRLEVPVHPKQPLSFCFRDNHNRWDNNNGSNWTINVNPY